MAARKRKTTTRRRKPVQAKVPARVKASSSSRRRWTTVIVTGLILAGAAYWFVGMHRPSCPPPAIESSQTPVVAQQVPNDLFGDANTLAQIKAEELKLARQVKAAFPRDVKARILLGNVFYQHGDIPEAMDVWTQALSLDARDVKLYLRLGIAAAELGKPEQALAYWGKGLQVNPDDSDLRWRMANVHIDQGRHREAAVLLERACEIAPSSLRNFFLLGQTYLQLQDYDRAKSNYEKAIELAPDSYNAYYGLANVYLRLKERDKAQVFMQRFRDLKQARDARPEKQIKVDEVPDARMRMARRYMEAVSLLQKAKQDQAVEMLLKRALHLDPGNANYLEKMGVHYYAQGRLPEALGIFEQARKVDPNNLLFYLNTSKIYVAQRRPDLAEKTLAQTIARFPGNGLAYGEFAQFYLQVQPSAPRALALARQAVQHQASARHYFLLARASDVNHDYTGALRAIEQALALDPTNQKYRMLHERLKQKL